jgi:tetratricopeptide (TPR) repeat protein
MSAILSASPPVSRADAPAASGPWIYRPWLDLLVGCGGWSAPLLLLAFHFSDSYSRAWTVAFYFLALLFNYPHFMATVYRAYHTRTEFAKYRIFTVHVSLLLAAAGLATHLWYPLLPWIFTIYICWSPWHYTGQNFGLMVMFARRAGVSLVPAERRSLHLAFVASFLLLLLSFHTGRSNDPLVISLGLPAKLTAPARGVLAIFFLVCVAWAFRSMARRSPFRSMTPSLVLATTQFLWFLLPAVIELLRSRGIPQTRYSSGILAVLHSAQYLWITSYYQGREARAAGNSWSFRRYLLTLVAGGIALFIPGPWIASRVFHADFASSFLTFMALVNIHHFLLDGALWKLRDSRVASFLLGQGAAVGSRKSAARAPSRSLTHWLLGESSGARGLRLAAVFLLIAWAAVDQLHFYWANQPEGASLRRAALLNPRDSSVQLRLAREEHRAGHSDAALASLRLASSVSPTNLSLQEAYARGLIEAGRDADAFAEYRRILERWPESVDSLVNAGLLAARLGRGEEAIADWQRAIAIDARQMNAQLYLAQALDQSGELQAAARHYRVYISLASDPARASSVDRATVLAALIRVADADAAVNQAAEAQRGYETAIHLAEKISNRILQSLALAHLADLQERQGNVRAALLAYQQALALDATLTDATGAATDWFNYGQFLRRQHAPDALVLACFAKARELTGETRGVLLSSVLQAQEEVQSGQGRGKAASRSAASAADALRIAPESLPAAH